MSTLDLPRIYFSGAVSWNPATANNNDQFPTYDYLKAELNWEYLATQDPPITRTNYRAKFPEWILKSQVVQCIDGQTQHQPPSEWNYYGGNDSAFVQGDALKTLVSGGQTAFRSPGGLAPLLTGDPLVGQPVSVLGTQGGSARLIDVNPDAFWCSQLYMDQISLGSSDAGYLLSGATVPGRKGHSRWINVLRNMNVTGAVQIAGVAGAVFQTCLPNEGLQIVNKDGNSKLLAALDAARCEPGVAGVMVRFVVYRTRYFDSEEILAAAPALLASRTLTGSDELTCQYAALLALWREELAAGEKPSQNPAISTAVGTVGLWREGELVNMPGDRHLFAQDQVTPQDQPNPVPFLGPAAAKLHRDARVVSLDMGSTWPELNEHESKADFGTVRVVLRSDDGGSATLGELPYSDYDEAAYLATAGVVDVPLPDDVTADQVAAGRIAIAVDQTSDDGAVTSATALIEPAGKLSAQTADRGVYVDQGETARFTIQVRQNGAPPVDAIKVRVVQYLAFPPAPAPNGASWILPNTDPSDTGEGGDCPIWTAQPPILDLLDQTFDVPPGDGEFEVSFSPTAPGSPVLAFFPYLATDDAPAPPNEIGPVAPGDQTITTIGYTSIRCLPFDDDVPGQFAVVWNSTYSREVAWSFIYNRIFYLYDMLFPVMAIYAQIDLGDEDAVIQFNQYIQAAIARDRLPASNYMPVTRDLSEGKRVALQMWGYLIQQDFAPAPITPDDRYDPSKETSAMRGH